MKNLSFVIALLRIGVSALQNHVAKKNPESSERIGEIATVVLAALEELTDLKSEKNID